MLTKNKRQQNPLMDGIGDWNPQLFREIKGRFKGKNIAIATAISALFQTFLYLTYEGSLPTSENRYYGGRYCLNISSDRYRTCVEDAFGNLINWQLWWLDIFIWMGIFAIFALLVAGTYLLIADLSKEKNRGTLDFIRMSPQTATKILIGKILGVPILIYLGVILALPLNLLAGLSAGIPLILILAFYSAIVASCAFFYSAALLLGLVDLGIGGFKIWLGSLLVFLFLWLMTAAIMSPYDNYGWGNPFDWLALFHPGFALFYLVDATSLSSKVVRALNIQHLEEIRWYGQSLWLNPWTGIGFLLFNYAACTYWIWQGVKRSFDNPIGTVFSKKQSYFICGIFSFILVGFTVYSEANRYSFEANFVLLELLLVGLFLGLIGAISPQRQTLQDWARYRHQNSNRRSLIEDLIWGEKSPSTLAIAVNIVIALIFVVPGIIISPLGKYKEAAFFGLIFLTATIIILAAIAQLILFAKTPRRVIFASITVIALTIAPLAILGIFRIDPNDAPYLYFFTIIPMVGAEYATKVTVILSLLGQWLAIVGLNLQMTKQLKKAGESETKALLSN